MFKVGIIGSDNSHALAFSKLANLRDENTREYWFPDVKITAIYGLDRQQTKKVSEEGQIEYIAEKPEDLIGRVDAVMVVFRHGDLHARYALPFIKLGIPTWIDKPFTIKISEAKQLIEEADKNNTLLTGGSTCKYAHDVLMLKKIVEDCKNSGDALSGVLNFPGDLESEYGGLFFYGPHLVEMLMTIYGYDVKSVLTSTIYGNILAIAKYEGFQVVMNFSKESMQYYGIVYAGNKTIIREIDISSIYQLGFEKFVEMLRTQKRPLPLDQLLAPTVLLNAIKQSIETGREIFL